MTAIRLTNSKTRRKEVFVPIDPRNVRMYVCGPTVYDRAHLGNARPVVVFDMLFRLLRHVYGADCVSYVRNITDIDDKIIARARETGREADAITEETARWFFEDMAMLGALEPSSSPRATAHVPQMIAMIEELILKGHAYEVEGHALFRVRSFGEYGKLSGRSVEDMIAGARVEVAPYKEDPMDFVLWKPSTAEQPGWPSPWGRGRPGWHIECSAMASELLGRSFDIHGGGSDLMFPHHENEIAQSRCAHPEGEFARVWMHNEMLQVEGKKMAKSAGNFFTVRDLLDRGVSGETIRFAFLSTHYSKPMDWTARKADDAEKTLRKWREMTRAVDSEESAEPEAAVISALADDLNAPGAIAELHRLAGEGESRALKASAALLGLLGGETEDRPDERSGEWAEILRPLLERRLKAREEKDFSTADKIRDLLSEYSVSLEDRPDGTTTPTIDARSALVRMDEMPEARIAVAGGRGMDGKPAEGGSAEALSAYARHVSKAIEEALG